MFYASLTPSIKIPESSSDFMILIISSTSSFEMANAVPFPALTTPFPHIAPYIVDADAIVANSGRKVLAKGTPTLINGPTNLPNNTPRNLPNSMISDNCALLNFISFGIWLAKEFSLLFSVLLIEIIHDATLHLEKCS